MTQTSLCTLPILALLASVVSAVTAEAIPLAPPRVASHAPIADAADRVRARVLVAPTHRDRAFGERRSSSGGMGCVLPVGPASLPGMAVPRNTLTGDTPIQPTTSDLWSVDWRAWNVQFTSPGIGTPPNGQWIRLTAAVE